MVAEFKRLKEEEKELMYKAPLLVCILVAGADGKIDRKEIKKGISLANNRWKSDPFLAPFMKELGQDVEDKMKILLQQFPMSSTTRNEQLGNELQKINAILPNLENSFSQAYYHMLLELARGIAGSSGGILGMGSISPDEEKLLKLEMIKNPNFFS